MRTALLVLVGLLVAAALAWNAGEMRYENCLQAAQARNPLGDAGLTRQEREQSSEFFGDDLLSEDERPPEVSVRPLERRRDAIADCSRLPW
jgi:hypothetical protein